jgi:hypothetical protein
MVAGAIMAFFAMVLLQSNELQTRMMTTNEAQMETFTLLFQVQQVMTDPVSCSISIGQAFGRVTDLRDLGKNGPTNVPVLYRAFKNASGHFEAVKFLAPEQIIGNHVLKITHLQVQPHKIFDGQVDLIIGLERLKKGVFGGVETEKRIAINVDLVGPDHANAFDGIMCLNPGQPSPSGSTARDVKSVIESGITTENAQQGSAKASTDNALAKACADAGGAWNMRENRCGSASTEATSDALKTACSSAGGQWDDAGRHCGVAAH